MGFNYTGQLTNNGTNNLLSLLTTAGYNGDAIVHREAVLTNPSTTVTAYIHFTDRNANAPGVKQVETCVVVGTITTAGNATLTLTAAGMTGSPIALTVALALGDTADDIAIKFATAMDSNVNVNAFGTTSFDAQGNLVWTARVPAANDATMNIAYADDTSVGLTDDASSNNTTAGSLATTTGIPILTGSASVPSSVYTFPKGTDLSTIWVNTASSIALNAAVNN